MIKTILNKIKYAVVCIILIYICIILLSMTNLQYNFKDESKPNDPNSKISNKHSVDLAVASATIAATDVIHGPEILEWINLTPDLYILQAYLDLRKANQPFIRILVIVRKSAEINQLLSCAFESGTSYDAIKYEFNENHGMEFGGYIYSCDLSGGKFDRDFVTIAEKNSNKILKTKLKILTVNNNLRLKNFTICVPPLYGNIDYKKLISFIEMNIILGAQHFYIYDYEIQSKDVNKVLNYYTKNGVMTVSKWTIPDTNIWYNGQMSNIHHCLYENIGNSKYTIFQDIDELVVPLRATNWPELMAKIDNGQHCGYKISSIFLKPSQDPLMYMSSVERSTNVNKFRSKCIVRPELIFEQGIHHISKQNVEELTPKSADSGEVLLFHYKQCDSMFGFDCSSTNKIDLLQKYSKQIQLVYNKVLRSF